MPPHAVAPGGATFPPQATTPTLHDSNFPYRPPPTRFGGCPRGQTCPKSTSRGYLHTLPRSCTSTCARKSTSRAALLCRSFRLERSCFLVVAGTEVAQDSNHNSVCEFRRSREGARTGGRTLVVAAPVAAPASGAHDEASRRGGAPAAPAEAAALPRLLAREHELVAAPVGRGRRQGCRVSVPHVRPREWQEAARGEASGGQSETPCETRTP